MKKNTVPEQKDIQTAQSNTPHAAGRISEARMRILFIAGFFALLLGIVAVRLYYLQVTQYEEYTKKVLNQQLRDTTISANRGTIYDCNMKVLASSATVWNVVVAPNAIKTEDEGTVADILCSQLENVDRDTLLEKLANKNSAYYMVKKQVGKDVTDAIREAFAEKKLSGVSFEQSSRRYYPYGAFASSVIGFVGSDNQGLSGLEAYYDEELSGVDGRIISAKDGWGADMDYDDGATYPATDGYSLVLTIDEVIQHYLEKYLEQAVNYHHVKQKGVGIVMDVNTGAILAMATIPDYDLNDPFTLVDTNAAAAVQALSGEERNTALVEAREAQWRNKAVSDLYEPGSVFKIVTAAAALDDGAATLNSSYTCTGSYVVEGVPIRCSHTSGHGVLSFGQALLNSCNPSFIQIGQQMGIDAFCDYVNAFGMTEKTGIDLPGESRSLVYTAENMGPVELASCSFGQSNKVTPIQMITAVSAAVNGGYLVQPHVVSQIVNAEGEIVQNISTQASRQVVSEDVSVALRGILEETVSDGPGNLAYVLGYRVGGKSGTSQKLDKKQAEGEQEVYIASFVGFAPADDPQIAVLIVLDEPDSYSYYGGQLAAPVVGSIMADVLPYLGVEASYSQNEMGSVEIGAPYCVGSSVTAAQVTLQKKGLTASVQGDGDYVVAQFPTAGTSLRQGSSVVLYTVSDESQTNLVTVPNLIGRTAGVAEQLLTAAGLNFSRTGSYKESSSVVVDTQSLEAGMQVPAGTVVTVNFTDNSLVD